MCSRVRRQMSVVLWLKQVYQLRLNKQHANRLVNLTIQIITQDLMNKKGLADINSYRNLSNSSLFLRFIVYFYQI